MVWDKRLRQSLIFNCDITPRGVENVELTPVFINDNYQPEIMNAADGADLLRKVHALSDDLRAETLEWYDKKMATYLKDASEYQSLYRKKSHRYFMKNLYRFSPRILHRQILTYIKNRAHEMRIRFSRTPE